MGRWEINKASRNVTGKVLWTGKSFARYFLLSRSTSIIILWMTIVRTNLLTWKNWRGVSEAGTDTGQGQTHGKKRYQSDFFSHLIYFPILLATYLGALNLGKLSLTCNQYSTVYMRRASKNLPQGNLFSVPFLARVLMYNSPSSSPTSPLTFVIFRHDTNSGSNQWNKAVYPAPYFHVTSLL